METIGIYTLLAGTIALQAVTVTALRKQRTPLPAVSKVGPEIIILDTCALIDGRIQDLVKAGFVNQQLYIPQRVVEELQFLADHGDAHKRSRARFGLDVAQALQESLPSKVVVIDGDHANKPVDDVLVILAKRYNAALYTTDYNLNKVARIHGVNVLNVNELAHALRPIHLPGERVTVKIVQKGESKTQGVGYLEDGTMVVIEGAARAIGSQVSASIERMLQTEAGKMVFAKTERSEGAGESNAPARQTRRGAGQKKNSARHHTKQPRA